MPRWPTFGLWLDRRDPKRPMREKGEDLDVWLPKLHRKGWGDNWNRSTPRRLTPRSAWPALKTSHVAGQTLGRLSARDRHERCRLARPDKLAPASCAQPRGAAETQRGQGGLHIGMSRKQILVMAHRYGTQAGKVFVERFADRDGHASPDWCEQRWVRLVLLINGLRRASVRVEGRRRVVGTHRAADSGNYTSGTGGPDERSRRREPAETPAGSITDDTAGGTRTTGGCAPVRPNR